MLRPDLKHDHLAPSTRTLSDFARSKLRGTVFSGEAAIQDSLERSPRNGYHTRSALKAGDNGITEPLEWIIEDDTVHYSLRRAFSASRRVV